MGELVIVTSSGYKQGLTALLGQNLKLLSFTKTLVFLTAQPIASIKGSMYRYWGLSMPDCGLLGTAFFDHLLYNLPV